MRSCAFGSHQAVLLFGLWSCLATLISFLRFNRTLDLTLPTYAWTADDRPPSHYATEQTSPFDCSQIGNVTIVRQLGKGNNKVAFEVILPSGIHAAAKRCNTGGCLRRRDLLQEGNFFRLLQEQYGDQSLKYYGACSFYTDHQKPHETTQNFEWGPTLFLELATPMMETWETEGNKTIPISEELEDLRIIARQYDNFVGGRILLRRDNRWPHQYVRTASGIRHIDFDTVIIMPPSSKSLLEYNCQVLLGEFGRLEENDPRLNCTEAYSRLSRTSAPTKVSQQ